MYSVLVMLVLQALGRRHGGSPQGERIHVIHTVPSRRSLSRDRSHRRYNLHTHQHSHQSGMEEVRQGRSHAYSQRGIHR